MIHSETPAEHVFHCHYIKGFILPAQNLENKFVTRAVMKAGKIWYKFLVFGQTNVNLSRARTAVIQPGWETFSRVRWKQRNE